MPVRITDLSITEEAFDVDLNPIRAKVSLGLRVLSVDDLGFDHRGGTLFMGYLRNKEGLAGRGAVRLPLGAGHRGDLRWPTGSGTEARQRSIKALLAAGAVPTTPFPPTSRYAGIGVDAVRADPGDQRRGSAACRSCAAALRARGPSASRCSTRHVVEGDRRDLLAARHLGDAELWWRLADANGAVDPRDADRARSAARLRDHAARGTCRGRAMAESCRPVRLQLLRRARPSRCRRRGR